MSAGQEPGSSAHAPFDEAVELLVGALGCSLKPELVTELERLAEGSVSVSATSERFNALLVLARRLAGPSTSQPKRYTSFREWEALIHEVLGDGVFRTQAQLCTEINARIDARTDGSHKHMTPKNLWRLLKSLEKQRRVVSMGKGRSKVLSWVERGGPSKPASNAMAESGSRSKPLGSVSTPPSPETLPSRSLASASPTGPAAPKKGVIVSP